MAAALERYGHVMNEHEADALALWHVYVFGAATPIRPRRVKKDPGRSVAAEAEKHLNEKGPQW